MHKEKLIREGISHFILLIFSKRERLLTLARFGIIAFAAYFMSLSLHTRISPIWILLIGGIEVLTTIIPLTINGGVTPNITAARYVIGLLIQYGFGVLSLLFIRRVHYETTH
jgi:hypothetical protein